MLFKVEACQTLNEEEKRLYESHPEVASKLLAAVPRLEDVAAIVMAQFGPLNITDLPDDLRKWDIRKAGQVLLRAAIEYDRLLSRGGSRDSAVKTLRESNLRFPSTVLKALACLSTTPKGTAVRQIRLADLTVGMTLDEDLVSPKGIRLVPSGAEVTTTLMIRLTSIAGGVGVAEPFRVRVAP
jgi:hypothetical protein